MAQPLNLDAYLARINYTGPRTPTYDTLAGILRAHIASIPFESFDVLLGRPIRLDPGSLQAKIVTGHRGGYCFEHGSLMHAALEAIGFAPVRHAARVVLFEPRHEKRASAHVPHGYSWRCYLRDRSGLRTLFRPFPNS